MRRVKPEGSERGAIAPIVAILMVVLLGFAAIAIDVGVLYSEKAQLQNGADAAALSIAQTCAKDSSAANAECSAATSSGSLAKSMADSNALDGTSNPRAVTLDSSAGKVSVSVGALESGATANRVSLYFARALGINDAEVTARASAAWGKPTSGPVIFPMALAECKFNLAAGETRSVVQELEQGSGCGRVPGGFGWIDSAACMITITAGEASDPGIWFESDPGASAPQGCSTSDFDRVKDKTVLFPLYDLASGEGRNAKYYAKGFAAFRVTAYRFASDRWSRTPAEACSVNKCIKGYFENFVSLDTAFAMSPGTTGYGADVVKLTLEGTP